MKKNIKKSRKFNIKWFIEVGITLLIIGLIVLKWYMYRIYEVDNYDNNVNKINITDTYDIKTKEVDSIDYLEYNGVKVDKNLLGNYEVNKSLNDSVVYQNIDDKSILMISCANNYLYSTYTKEEVNFDNKISNEYLEQYFQKHNINNDIEFIKYLDSVKDKKVGYLSFISTQKDSFVTSALISSLFTNKTNVILLTGSYEGFLFNETENHKLINISNGNKRCLVKATGSYSNDDIIYKLLETMIIE